MRSYINSILSRRGMYTIFGVLFITIGTFIAIQYANGNLRLTEDGVVQGTGLLAANSFPPGAEVLVNDKLVTATDDTIYLEPGEYTVQIRKDGYAPWSKNLRVEQELVTQTNAKLFPSAPSLSPLTFTGVQNLHPSPDGQKVVYYTASASAERKNGLYVLELNSGSTLSFQRGPRQISFDSENFDLETADFIWSPDSSELIVMSNDREVLLNVSTTNDLDTLTDISFQRKQILSAWEQEMYIRERQFLAEFPVEILKIAASSAKNLYISPDKKRLLYTATQAATIPDTIVPPIPATNTQPEERQLVAGGIYVYDREEDKNFRVASEASDATGSPSGTLNLELNLLEGAQKKLLALDILDERSQLLTASASAFEALQATDSAQTAKNFNTYHSSLYANTVQWFPDSKHIIFLQDRTIKVMEYDASNKTTIYAGPFIDQFVYPWPDGSRLLIKTAFSPDSPTNLYAIELNQ
ncbi:MAG: PEGA domain-containing protein [Microgenomates group bacterium]